MSSHQQPQCQHSLEQRILYKKGFPRSRENTGNIMSLKKGVMLSQKPKSKRIHLEPNHPCPATFQHFPPYLERSPYGLESKMRTRQVCPCSLCPRSSGCGLAVSCASRLGAERKEGSLPRGGSCAMTWGQLVSCRSGFGRSVEDFWFRLLRSPLRKRRQAGGREERRTGCRKLSTASTFGKNRKGAFHLFNRKLSMVSWVHTQQL